MISVISYQERFYHYDMEGLMDKKNNILTINFK